MRYLRYQGNVPAETSPDPSPGPGGAGRGTPSTRWWLAVVRNRSMLPTLADGDRLLVRSGDRLASPGRIGVIRLPGGRPIAVKRLARREGSGWWVERDNPGEGVDSRQVGAIPDDALLGVVVARVWPRPRRL